MKWIKASLSTSNGACVEVAAIRFSKATQSVQNGACVEVGPVADGVVVRDSKDPDGPVLRFTAEEWAAFLDGAKNGEFDELAG